MRFFIKADGGEANNNFDDAALADRALSMQHLRVDVEGGAAGNTTRSSKYNKLMVNLKGGLRRQGAVVEGTGNQCGGGHAKGSCP